MARKILGYIVLFAAIAVFVISSVDDLTRVLAQKKYDTKSWWGSDKYIYGDLYGMSYLPQFKIPGEKGGKIIGHDDRCQAIPKTFNIYATSDSYTWDLFKDPANFCGADKSGYAASNFRDVLSIHLDSSKKNILVIETTERNVWTLLTDTAYLLHFVQPLKPGETPNNEASAEERKKFHFKFNMKDADANFEFNLWDYRFLTPLKQLKARLTFNWFNRANPDVIVSPDKKYLLYEHTVDTAYTESSFKPFNNQKANDMVTGLNLVYDHYKKLGFYDVYLSVIPNPVTILYPRYKDLSYNQLIPKLQDNPALKLKVFDSYHLFLAHRNLQLFSRSDTHWTSVGEKLWLSAFNQQLQKDLQ